MSHRKEVALARNLRQRRTWAESLLWRWLRGRRFARYKFRRQHPIGGYILDFYCDEARLNIELDGSGHGVPVQGALDRERDAWLERQGVHVLRIWNSRLRREGAVVRENLWRLLHERAPHSTPQHWTVRPTPNRDEGLQDGENIAPPPSP
jgi:adenine-specific DNA-methyltransferase